MRDARLPIRFGMVADRSAIRIVDFERDSGFVCILDTADIRRESDPGFGTKRTFHHYLTTLVNAWLRDLVYHWKSQIPPGSESFQLIGLLPVLENGDTRREVPVRTHPLR